MPRRRLRLEPPTLRSASLAFASDRRASASAAARILAASASARRASASFAASSASSLATRSASFSSEPPPALRARRRSANRRAKHCDATTRRTSSAYALRADAPRTRLWHATAAFLSDRSSRSAPRDRAAPRGLADDRRALERLNATRRTLARRVFCALSAARIFRALASSICPTFPARRKSFVSPNWYDSGATLKCFSTAAQNRSGSPPYDFVAAGGRSGPNRAANFATSYRVGYPCRAIRTTSSTPQHRSCRSTAPSSNAAGLRAPLGLTHRTNRGEHASSFAMRSDSCVLNREDTDSFRALRPPR